MNPAAAPVEAPKEIKPETGIEQGVQNAVGGVEGGVVGGVDRRHRRRPGRGAAAAPAAAATARAGPRRRQHQAADEGEGRQAGVSGDRAVGARAGRRHHRGDDRPERRVQEAKVLRSIPLLDAAALDAVKQWQFTPTLLNGVPVPVIMTVTVNFTLQ